MPEGRAGRARLTAEGCKTGEEDLQSRNSSHSHADRAARRSPASHFYLVIDRRQSGGRAAPAAEAYWTVRGSGSCRVTISFNVSVSVNLKNVPSVALN